jgi:hypothetical protein
MSNIKPKLTQQETIPQLSGRPAPSDDMEGGGSSAAPPKNLLMVESARKGSLTDFMYVRRCAVIRSIHDRRKGVVSVEALKRKLQERSGDVAVPPMSALDEGVFPVSISYEREEELLIFCNRIQL